MFSLLYIVLASLPLLFSEASYVYNLPPCGIKDYDCMRELFQKVIHEYGETGIADINVAPLDPMKLSNIKIKVLDDFEISIKEGVLKGFKNCKINKSIMDLEKQLLTNKIVCDALTIKGHFTIAGSNQLLQSVFGTTSVNGEGQTKIKLEKVTVAFELPATVIKHEDGEIYFKLLTDNPKYTYDIQKLTFSAKNLVVGGNDLSELVTTYVNGNWKTLLNSYGKQIMDKVMYIATEFQHLFYDNISTKKLIIEDLTSYVNN